MEPTASAAVIATKAIGRPINDLYELGKNKFKAQLLKTKTAANINRIHKIISSTHKVKTIWQIDKEVSLKSFYYPSKLIIDDIRTPVNFIKKIPDETNIVIQGIVGQGKSIFLRYLSYQEANSGQRIPIFFELRRIDGSETLDHHIRKILSTMNFDPTDEVIDFLFSSGKIVLLLDGFDEISSEKVNRLINEIENISERYPELTIIISSRPDSGIERSAYFRIYRLAPLEPEDIPGFLSKISTNKEHRQELTNAIEKSSTNIKTLLTTPLMLTLLVLVYRSENKIPEQLSEFYENLFVLLLSRHDKSKPGYMRERATQFNERKLQQIFEAFCFVTRKKELSTVSESEIHTAAEEAFRLIGVQCDSSSFIKDITKVSNLMLEEGYNYHFIHKSIQEFHAANYIKSRPAELATKFYAAMKGFKHQSWAQEINFLSQIDTYRHDKYLYIPVISAFLLSYGVDPYDTWEDMSETQTTKALTQLTLGINLDAENMHAHHYSFGGMSMDYHALNFASDLLIKLANYGKLMNRTVISSIASAIKSDELASKAYQSRLNENTVTVSFFDYFEFIQKSSKARDVVNSSFKHLHGELQEKLALITTEENSLDI